MKLRRWPRLTLLAGALSCATGCLSMGTMQTASTLGKGNFQISAEAGAYGFSVPKSGAGGGNGAASPEVVPHFDVSFRYGLSDRVDIGVRTGWSLLELQAKFLFTNPANDRLAISLAPTLGGIFLGTSSSGGMPTTLSYFNLGLPLLVGIKHFRANELVFGPRLNHMLVSLSDSTGSAAVYLFGIGGSVGYAFSIGEVFKILPELAFNVPVAASATTGRSTIAGAGFGGVIWQLKVGLMFGRSGKRPAEPLPTPPPMPAPEPVAAPADPQPEPEPAPAPGAPAS